MHSQDAMPWHTHPPHPTYVPMLEKAGEKKKKKIRKNERYYKMPSQYVHY
jgi:hypothetical protein